MKLTTLMFAQHFSLGHVVDLFNEHDAADMFVCAALTKDNLHWQVVARFDDEMYTLTEPPRLAEIRRLSSGREG